MKERRVIPENVGKLMSPEDQKRYGFKSWETLTLEQEEAREKDMHGLLTT